MRDEALSFVTRGKTALPNPQLGNESERHTNEMRRILATDFGIWPAFNRVERFSDAILASTPHWAQLANYLLLYDQLVIPTGNLQILPVLRMILGEDTFDELIRTKGIVLARFDRWFGYVGTGGLRSFSSSSGQDRPPNIAHSYFLPFEEALDIALKVFNPPSDTKRRSVLKNLLLDNVVHLPTEEILDTIRDETYRDVQGSPYLQALLYLRNSGRSLDNLAGLPATYFTIFNPHVEAHPTDVPEIQSILRIAFENVLLKIGSHTMVTEVTGDDTTLSILRAKGQRIGFAVDGNKAFAQIQSVSGVPDIGTAFAHKQLSSSQILDLRYSKHCQALRDWFEAGHKPESAEETVARYVQSIGKPSLVEALPAKMLRFAVTTGLGAVEPITGAIASALDGFLLSKWFPAASPRLFLKQAKVMLVNTPVVAAPIIKGRDRNAKCSCGSGKKFKKCCGK